MSRRAKRMERHHKRNKGKANINLVSLMDIFTILVFFLLVNSSDVQVLPSAKSLKLPESIAEQKPKETVVVMVSPDEILVQGHSVITLEEVYASKEPVIGALVERLKEYARESRLTPVEETEAVRREITIMGDKSIPFSLLKRVMLTCAKANYETISLAVMKKPGADGGVSL
ncbi:MAG: biopolymer transporter ExbD [Candidatus Polarisedimenticolaceae bacterium]|nr:biopolymer transporter ExbD [Candidatus Polarisedimenticolaceae bacterium]